MLTNVRPIVAQFVEASNARDLERFVACFAADALVDDEAQTHRGIDEIRAWKRQTESRYRYTIQPVDVVERNGRTMLTGTLIGDFPGSPVDLIYEFTIRDDAIAALSIQPAGR
jgi:hypothetical protein